MPIHLTSEKYGFVAPQAATDVVLLSMEHGSIFTAKFENYGNSDLTVKLQDSEDGVSYVDVAGSSCVVVPRGAVPCSGFLKKFFKVVASGNTEGSLEINLEGTTNITKI